MFTRKGMCTCRGMLEEAWYVRPDSSFSPHVAWNRCVCPCVCVCVYVCKPFMVHTPETEEVKRQGQHLLWSSVSSYTSITIAALHCDVPGHTQFTQHTRTFLGSALRAHTHIWTKRRRMVWKKKKKSLHGYLSPLCKWLLIHISKKEERNAVMSSPSSSQQWKTCSVELIPSDMWESSLGAARRISAWGVCCACVSDITASGEV